MKSLAETMRAEMNKSNRLSSPKIKVRHVEWVDDPRKKIYVLSVTVAIPGMEKERRILLSLRSVYGTAKKYIDVVS